MTDEPTDLLGIRCSHFWVCLRQVDTLQSAWDASRRNRIRHVVPTQEDVSLVELTLQFWVCSGLVQGAGLPDRSRALEQ